MHQTQTSSTSVHAERRLVPGKKKRQRKKDEVSLEDEEHSLGSCFFGPQWSPNRSFGFQPNLLRQIQHGEAVTTKACSAKYIPTVRRPQGASGSPSAALYCISSSSGELMSAHVCTVYSITGFSKGEAQTVRLR